MKRIYLDHASTTPVHPQVAQTMFEKMAEFFGNPASIHSFGREARERANQAKKTLGENLGADPDNLLFTSGGTEADNLAIFGSAMAGADAGGHIITTQIEHLAVLNSCRRLEKMGFEITYLPVDESGRLEVSQVEDALREDTRLITIMYGNNEVGTLQPIDAVGELAREHNIIFHTDAVQALGSVSLDLSNTPVDLASFSSHKVNGPKGVGCLYAQTDLRPLLYGGQQQKQLRPGTENVPGMIGFAKAVQRACNSIQQNQRRHGQMKEHLLNSLREMGVSYAVNGHSLLSLPHILNISFCDISADVLVKNLDLEGIAVSSGSACTAGTLQPSHVVTAMYDENRASSAVRFSFGRGNTIQQMEWTAQAIGEILGRIGEVEENGPK